MNVHDRKVKRTSSDSESRDAAPEGEGAVRVRCEVGTHKDAVGDGRGEVAPTVARLHSETQSPEYRESSAKRSPVLRVIRTVLKVLLPLGILAGGYFGYNYLLATKPEEKKQAKTERAYSVASVVAAPGNYQPNLILYGSTVAGRQVEIRSLVSGRVIAASDQLHEGGIVSNDDVLIEIDSFDYENAIKVAQAQLKEAIARKSEFEASIVSDTASLDYAERQTKLAVIDLNRAKPLVKRGAVSEKTVDDRQQVVLQRQQAADQLTNSIAVWKTRVAQQEATIARLDAAHSFAHRRLEETKLKAPFNAYVSEVSSQVGRMVGANDKVATLVDRDAIEARFTMTDEQFGRIVSNEGSLVGRKITIDWVLGGTTFTYEGAVVRLGARVSSSTGGLEVFARVKRLEGSIPIRPGAFITVRIPDTKFVDVFKLSEKSLYFGNTVYVIEDSRLVSRKVEVVGSDGAGVLVRGELKAGEKVLNTRISTPGDGILVKEVAPL